MSKFPCWLLLSACLLSGTVVVCAQAANPAPPSTNAVPATTAPGAALPAASPVPLANVATTITADTARLQEMQSAVALDHTAADLDQSATAIAPTIDSQKRETDLLLKSAPTLATLRTAHTAWQMLSDNLTGPLQTLSNRITQLDADENQLTGMRAKWQATAKSATEAPADVLSRINAVLGSIDAADKAVSALRSRLLTTQNGFALQSTRISAELDAIQRAQTTAVKDLFVRDNPPLWGLAAPSPAAPKAAAAGIKGQVTDLRAYVSQKFSTGIVQLLVFLVLSVLLIWVRRVIATRPADDPAVQHAAQVFRMPIAMAGLITLLISSWFYPLAPPLFGGALGAVALIPTVAILRRLIDPALFPILWALVVAYLVDHLRHLAGFPPGFARFYFLIEMAAALLFTVWMLRSERFCHVSAPYIVRILRAYAWLALAIFSLALISDILGYTSLANVLGNGILSSVYLAVVLYAAVRVADGLILAGLKIRPFALLGMVQRHYLRMGAFLSRIVRWIAFFCWLWETLEVFSIRAPIWNTASAILTYNIALIDFSLGSLLTFILIIWATILISRFARFVLAEEVFPNLTLGPGVPYVISTLVHYAFLLAGILLALSAVKFPLGQFAWLGAGLGVGLGLGLQNIMNNFVSGLILLFERPIKVGDVIQVDTAMGTVENIGIRASVIRITDGSEVVMPNGNLVSNPVTNWTFSDWRRVISVPVAVAAKADPARVMALLVETAKAHPLVLKDPAPTVLFTNFTGAALNFDLHAWTSSHEWAQLRSDLALSISQALARENIAIT